MTQVCELDDVWIGEMDVFEVDGTEVLIVHVDEGDVNAYDPVCPHQDFPLIDGELSDCILTCSAHLWQFDVASGEGTNPTGTRLKAFPSMVKDGAVMVALPQPAPTTHTTQKETEAKTMNSANENRPVGPIMHKGEVGEAVVEAIRIDNEDLEVFVEDHASYYRIQVHGECVINTETVGEMLGTDVTTSMIEQSMPSFEGFIRTTSGQIRFLP